MVRYEVSMLDADFQYRNNDPSENVQVNFTTADGVSHILSFVATRPHWCEAERVFGDLFAAPLSTVFEGDAFPLTLGSREEAEAIISLRRFVESAISDPATILERRQPKMTASDGRERSFVWFLRALERRRERFLGAEPQHPADGSQPSRSVPNSTPGAAGSRR